MSHKHHGGPGPVPPANRPPTGPGRVDAADRPPEAADTEAGFQPQDPKRRLGDYATEGEHARQQPGPANDGGAYGR